MKIIVTPPFTEEQKSRIRKAAGPEQLIFRLKSEVTEELLSGADVILGNLDDPSQARFSRGLKWIQLNNAGTEGYCEPGLLPEGAVLTNATGAYGLAISEHMIASLFMLRKKLHLYYADQLRHEWKREGHVGVVQGTVVLVVGLGDIGRTFARKMRALGCYTIGIRRRVSEKTLAGDAADKYRLSLGGIYAPEEGRDIHPPAALEEFLRRHPQVDRIEFCLDNDPPGRAAAVALARLYGKQYQVAVRLPPIVGFDYGDLAQAALEYRTKNKAKNCARTQKKKKNNVR